MSEVCHRSRGMRTADTKAVSRGQLGELKEGSGAQVQCDLGRASEGRYSSDRPGLVGLVKDFVKAYKDLAKIGTECD